MIFHEAASQKQNDQDQKISQNSSSTEPHPDELISIEKKDDPKKNLPQKPKDIVIDRSFLIY